MDFVTIDFETATCGRDNPCEIGLTFVEGNVIKETKSWLIKPQCYPHFDPFCVSIHGIQPKECQHSPAFPDIWTEILPLIQNKFLLAHNASFDFSVIRATLDLYNIPYLDLTYGCTCVFSKVVWAGLPMYGLEHLCNLHSIPLIHHRAGESGLLALDWNNGNRTVLVDQLLSGLTVGTTLHTTAPEIYRDLIEATAFGTLAIIQRFEEYGVQVKEVINCGGIAEKSPFIMQIYADVCNRPMKISRSAQTCALGAAIFGAVAGGAFADVREAQKKMTGVKSNVYKPNGKAAVIYKKLYKLYNELHDSFGLKGHEADLYHVMKELIKIRETVRK